VTPPAAARAFFRKRFAQVGDPGRATHDRAYLKSDLRFYGVRVPEIRQAAADFARAHPALTRAELRAIVDALYATDWHEYRSVSIALLARYAAVLRESDLPWLAGLVRKSDTWAHVDWLAADVIGGVVERYPAGLKRLPVWANDASFWVRRTALLAQLRVLSPGAGDFAVFARLAAAMLDEREFFIRKAIGWVLREVSKKRPELVFAFLRAHRAEVSSLSLQEGANYLPAAMRTKLGLPAKAAWQLRDERDA
jgi:3-methyladenine DNA glycosylase AlkD